MNHHDISHTSTSSTSGGPAPDAVVVGCDGSWPSQQAVVVATAEARRRGAPLVVLVVERTREADGGGRSVGAAERARSVGDAARQRAKATDPNVRVDVVAVADVRDHRVDQLAQRASLLVLGAYGRGGQVALSLGSVSDVLARSFRCPLLLAHDRAGTTRQAGTRPPLVIAAVDRTDAATTVVAAAADVAASRHVPLLVVHAVPALTDGGARLAGSHDWVAGILRAAKVPSWIPHRTVVTSADPVAAVLDRSEPDDVVVVSTRGEGRLAGLISGSVSRAILDAALCDVMVVHARHAPTAANAAASAPTAEAARTLAAPVALGSDDCWSLLRSAPVGRLAVVSGGRPDIFPVNHVVHRDTLVFRTAPGTKLDSAVDQTVAFEVDGYDSATGDAWSVVVKGVARELTERDEVMRATRLPIVPWQGGAKPRLVQIDVDTEGGSVTGRRFHVFGGVTSVRSSGPEGWLSPASDHGLPIGV